MTLPNSNAVYVFRSFATASAIAACLAGSPTVLLADNCGSTSDCYSTAQAAVTVIGALLLATVIAGVLGLFFVEAAGAAAIEVAVVSMEEAVLGVVAAAEETAAAVAAAAADQAAARAAFAEAVAAGDEAGAFEAWKAASEAASRAASATINDFQRNLVGDFLNPTKGSGLEGITHRLNNWEIPEKLSQSTLEAYRVIAKHAVDFLEDFANVQAKRLEAIERAIRELSGR